MTIIFTLFVALGKLEVTGIMSEGAGKAGKGKESWIVYSFPVYGFCCTFLLIPLGVALAMRGLVPGYLLSAALSGPLAFVSYRFSSHAPLYDFKFKPGSDEIEIKMMSRLGTYTTRTIKWVG